MKRTKIAIALLAMLAAAGVLLPAQAATANPASSGASAQLAPLYYSEPTSDCTRAGYACAWANTLWGGGAVGFFDDTWNWATIGSFSWINDNSESWENHGTSSFGNTRFFQYAGGSGINRCLNRGYTDSGEPDLSNRPSALVWVSSCSGYTQFAGQWKFWP